MTILLVTNNAIHMGGDPVKNVDTTTFDSTKLDYGIQVSDNTAMPVAHPHDEAVGDTAWYQWDFFTDGGISGTEDGYMFAVRDITGETIFRLNLRDGIMEAQGFGGATNGGQTSSGMSPSNDVVVSFKVSVTVNASAVSSTLYVNGSLMATHSTSNSRGLGKPRIADFSMSDAQGSFANFAVISSLIVSDSDLGNFGFTKLSPVSAGADVGMAGDGFAAMSDDNDTTGVTASSANEKNSYNMAAYANGSNINSYVATALIGAGPSGGSYRFYLLIGGVQYNGATVALTADLTTLEKFTWGVDPSDGAVWTAAKINAAQLGIEAL